MLRKFLVLINVFLFLTIVFFTFSPVSAYASTILFQDDFENGNINQWINVNTGPSSLWQIKYIDIAHSNMYGARIQNGSTIIDSITMSKSIHTPNYILEFDYLPITGVDNSLDSRWVYDSTRNYYDVKEVHYLGSNQVWTNFGCSAFTSIPPLIYGQINHIKIIYINQRIQFYLNGIQLIDYVDSNYVFSGSEYIGVRISTGAAYPTEVWFDNVIVKSLDEPITPTPTPINLKVPSIKQTSTPWASQVYNSAGNWAKDTSISAWGCALTSGAMILNYYGFNLLPNGIILDPGTLNSWLKSQIDGYVGKGFVNWIALSRLSKLATSINGITDFSALEYTRKSTTDKNDLISDLTNLTPDILEEPGHFIVAKGIDKDNILINDPYFDRQTLADYSDTFLNLGTYTPSSTDLSYIMLVADLNVDILVKDKYGNIIGESFIQQSIVNDNNPSDTNSPLKIYYLAKPDAQNFQLFLSSAVNKLGSFKAYLYTLDGSVKVIDGKALFGLNTNNYILAFNKTNSADIKLERKATIDDLISDILQLKKLKLINLNFADSLLSLAKDAKKDLANKNKLAASIRLKTLQALLTKVNTVLINLEAKNLLLSDVSYILKTL